MTAAIHPVVLAIIKSLQDEPHRWFIGSGREPIRDDGLNTSSLGDAVWVYEDIHRLVTEDADDCRITIKG